MKKTRLTAVVAMAALTWTSVAVAQDVNSPAEHDEMRAVLITGTSSGIGRRMTEVLSENGFFVYAGARKPDDLKRLDAMPNVKSIRLDVTIQSEIDAAVELVKSEGRGLYGLINNAGVSVMGPLIETPEEDVDFLLDVNLMGPYRVTKAFADLIIESKGRIMNVTSIAGIVSGPFGGVYSVSKHGLEAYTDTLAVELAGFGVAVAAVEPGNYKSQILASMVERMKAKGYAPKENSRYGSMLELIPGPLDRSQYKEPDEVAQAALAFLTSDSPKRRYMVVPNRAEAAITIGGAIQELVQLNEDQEYSFNRDELIRMLDEAMARSPSLSVGDSTTDSIHEAARNGDLKEVRRHINAGSNVNEKDPFNGSSPLIIAAVFGRTEVAKALIEAGSDVDQANNDGSTALHVAALFCHTDIVDALLENGADKNVKNNAGSTALDLVSGPFESMKGTYDFLGNILKPLGLELDYDEFRVTRPKIAEMLK
ncbi:MAG: SDR family NAD(P)-dependent oxidoreductase [Pirellulales bacterium]